MLGGGYEKMETRRIFIEDSGPRKRNDTGKGRKKINGDHLKRKFRSVHIYYKRT